MLVMYFICQVFADAHVWTESISKDMSADHQIVLGWKESMIAYCHFCLVFVFEHHLCMSACACGRTCNLEGVPAFLIFFALLSTVL
jgi:hypothetical protein